jgi:hypothetical protein
MTVADLKREVLVRHLEAWAPAALHKRRATYVHGYADADDGELAEAALGVFAEQGDLARGRELTMIAVGEKLDAVRSRLDAAGPGGAGLSVHLISGRTAETLGVAVKAAGGVRVPLLAFLDAATASEPPGPEAIAAIAAGKPAELLLTLPPATAAEVEDRRAALRDAGFPLAAAVDLVDDAGAQLMIFATTLGKSLEAFKETLWAVDEFAGVRYRDPGDPDGHLIDVSLNPHPGPLRREMLRHLATGPATVSELRTFALTETVYRAADANRVVQSLLTAGAVRREPEHGRLGGDVLISA